MTPSPQQVMPAPVAKPREVMPPPVSRFDTLLSPREEMQFREWKQKNAPQDSGMDYDLRGAFKADIQGRLPRDERGHSPDTFKKPNHPTFSEESMYHGAEGETGGRWETVGDKTRFIAGPTNLKYHKPEELHAYFKQYEPGVELVIPPTSMPPPGIPIPIPSALRKQGAQ